MDYSRYEKLRALVRGSFSSETQRLVDDALAYADEQLAGMTRYDGNQIMQYTDKVLSKSEIDLLKDAFDERNCPPKAYPLMNYSNEIRGLISSYRELYSFAAESHKAIEFCYSKQGYIELPE